jgi:hypothetical protein
MTIYESFSAYLIERHSYNLHNEISCIYIFVVLLKRTVEKQPRNRHSWLLLFLAHVLIIISSGGRSLILSEQANISKRYHSQTFHLVVFVLRKYQTHIVVIFFPTLTRFINERIWMEAFIHLYKGELQNNFGNGSELCPIVLYFWLWLFYSQVV